MGQQSTTSFGFALNSVAALGADASAADGLIVFTGLGSFIYENIQNGVAIQPFVAPVARVTTLTCVAPSAVGDVYSVNIEQPQPGGGTFRETVFVTSVVGSTANTMAAALNTAINSYISAGQLLGTSTVAAAVVTTTGTSAAPMFRITGSTPNITPLATTAGTPGVNTVAQMTSLNIENYVPTNNYTTVTWQYNKFGGSINNEATTGTYIYAVNEGDADAAALITKITELFNGLNPGAVTANPALIAKR